MPTDYLQTIMHALSTESIMDTVLSIQYKHHENRVEMSLKINSLSNTIDLYNRFNKRIVETTNVKKNDDGL